MTSESDPKTTPVSDALIDKTMDLQESNRRRVAAIEAQRIRLPDFTLGIVDLLADAALGVGTTARWKFTLEWETKYAEWLTAQEAEIHKAKLMAGNGAATPGGSKLHTVGREIPGL